MNHYSVPWRLIGAEVSVMVDGGQVRIHHAGIEVACHDKRLGRRERAVDRPSAAIPRADARGTFGCSAHLHGIVPCRPDPASDTDVAATSPTLLPSIELLRPLAEYEQVAGGSW